MGVRAGGTGQNSFCIAIGGSAGYQSQGTGAGGKTGAIAIGSSAAYNAQHDGIAIGFNSGNQFQKDGCISIGVEAGMNFQGSYGNFSCTALGNQAARHLQGNMQDAFENQVATDLGQRGYSEQMGPVAIGSGAGMTGQGWGCISIGAYSNAGRHLDFQADAEHQNQGGGESTPSISQVSSSLTLGSRVVNPWGKASTVYDCSAAPAIVVGIEPKWSRESPDLSLNVNAGPFRAGSTPAGGTHGAGIDYPLHPYYGPISAKRNSFDISSGVWMWQMKATPNGVAGNTAQRVIGNNWPVPIKDTMQGTAGAGAVSYNAWFPLCYNPYTGELRWVPVGDDGTVSSTPDNSSLGNVGDGPMKADVFKWPSTGTSVPS